MLKLTSGIFILAIFDKKNHAGNTLPLLTSRRGGTNFGFHPILQQNSQQTHVTYFCFWLFHSLNIHSKCVKMCQTVAGISMDGQFHEFFFFV